ncbi:uncharacterized protein LOC103364809, partial [Stegastes partitus]|uniref:Uncharacterized protein LOC103364809 n=1 Tax=Stegastes partitus TaxID=144197 RepID=A0A9Y4N1I7_9TELE
IYVPEPVGDGPVNYTVSSLTAGTEYTFTLLSVFKSARSSGVNITTVTAPPNTDRFISTGQNETSITLQWNKVNNSVSFILLFNGTETNISAPAGDGPISHTVSSLSPATNYIFTLFSVFENIRSSGVNITAVTAPPNTDSFRSTGQTETSITLQWNKVNNDVSFIVLFNGTETNISAPAGDGPVTHIVSSLTAGTEYTFTLFSVFENVRSSGVSITAVPYPPNTDSFRSTGQNETSITLQWNKVNNNVSFILQFNGTETNFSPPAGDGPISHTVSSLSPATKYIFTLFSVFENVGSSGVTITAVTGAVVSISSAQTRHYVFVETPQNWTNAQSICRRDYTDLATIENTADVDDVTNTTSNYTGKAWIGLYDDLENSWRWSLNDSSFYGAGQETYRNWDSSQPSNRGGQQYCVELFSASPQFGTWGDVNCNEIHRFVCYSGTVNGTASFVRVDIPLNWTDAQRFCRENYVDLASIRNSTENFIVRNIAGGHVVWIGLYRQKLWSDGSNSLFRHWAVGQPDSDGEQCVAAQFNNSGRWSDEDCSRSLPFVCFKTAPPNTDSFRSTGQDETSITLQWNKVNNNVSFILQFNGGERSISPPSGGGPINHTVSLLLSGTEYTFTLFSVFENVRSSGVSITAFTRGRTRHYVFVETPQNWTNAQSICRRDYTDLATIENTADVDDVTNTASNYTGKAWIGLYITSWRWSLNDSSFYGAGEETYRNWYYNRSYGFSGQQECVAMLSGIPYNGTWYMNFGCDTTLNFVCYRGTVNGTASFVRVDIPLSWTDAQRFCRENYVDLASIRNSTENLIVRNIAGGNFVWIGLYRQQLWSDGSNSLFRHWAVGQPDSTIKQCGAAQFNNSGRWSHEDCSRSLPFVCFNTFPPNAEGFRTTGQDETSITLQWNKVNNKVSFILQFNGTETNISAPAGDGPINHTISSLTAGTEYAFTLFSVFENIRSSGVNITAVTAPQNAEGFKFSSRNETSVTLQWNKVNNNVSFILLFNGTETNFNAPAGDGPINHTVSSLTIGTKYTFTLFSVFENIRSSGVTITAVAATF